MILFKKRYDTYLDEELMALLSKGDKRAFDELYNRYSGVLFGYFNKMLWRDREKAEDLVHDIFAKIIVSPQSFDVTRSFKTWLFAVACNMCKNEYKRKEVRKNTSIGIDNHISIKSDVNVFNEVQDRIFMSAFDESLIQLDDKHRDVFTLRHLQGFSLKEIADVLEINEGTVKSRLFYATKQLAEKLKEYQVVLSH
jgi:RNA polymerase sigma-70 factor (ECF subfamily)